MFAPFNAFRKPIIVSSFYLDTFTPQTKSRVLLKIRVFKPLSNH